MAIKHTTRTPSTGARQPINANTSITSSVRNRQASRQSVYASTFASLSNEKKKLVRQLQSNGRKHAAIMGATNTSNIAARPEFLDMLPLFVQKLLILDVFGSVGMKSRHQIIPYFKFIAETTKGETAAGTILNSPMVNRQGFDANFTGRVVKNEFMAGGEGATPALAIAYTPVLPGSVTLAVKHNADTTRYVDTGTGSIVDKSGNEVAIINYSDGSITVTDEVAIPANLEAGDTIHATYQYDNETVGPDADGHYGAKMAKGYLALDEIDLVAEAHELACYWSVFSAFAASHEYGANIGDMAKEAAFSELTAEINTTGFARLKQAARYNPAFDFNVAPVTSGSVVPSDYLNMLKLTLNRAAQSIYQTTGLSRPNRIVCGTDAVVYLAMIDGWTADSTSDTVGPYHAGSFDGYEVYVDPNYNPSEWVMSCKSNDIRRNSALFGEYMPFTDTAAIGLANQSVQQGYATMYGMKVVNPATIVSGKIVGNF